MAATATGLSYGGFWPRAGALLIDTFIFAPVVVLVLWAEKYRLFAVFWLIPSNLLALWYSVHLVARYGGTPGKLLMNISITKLDGSPISWSQAFIRNSPEFVWGIIAGVAACVPLLAMSDAQYAEIAGFGARGKAIQALLPSWYKPVEVVFDIWAWSELVVLLTNEKRRALHDFLAGTVVIRKRLSAEV